MSSTCTTIASYHLSTVITFASHNKLPYAITIHWPANNRMDALGVRHLFVIFPRSCILTKLYGNGFTGIPGFTLTRAAALVLLWFRSYRARYTYIVLILSDAAVIIIPLVLIVCIALNIAGHILCGPNSCGRQQLQVHPHRCGSWGSPQWWWHIQKFRVWTCPHSRRLRHTINQSASWLWNKCTICLRRQWGFSPSQGFSSSLSSQTARRWKAGFQL